MNEPVPFVRPAGPGDDDGLAAVVRASANRFGAKPCLITPARSISFAEFAHRVSAVANRFRSLGIGAGDRIAILEIDSIEYLECLYGLAVLGAIAVPLNYRQRLSELQYQVQNSGCRLLLANRRYAGLAEGLRPDLPLGWQPIDEFCSSACREGNGHEPELRGVGGQTPFAICYTSGTTGRPKGAVIEQRAACLRAMKLIIEFGIRESDVLHVMTPLFHISALIVTLIGIMRGAPVLVLPQFNLQESMEAVRRHRVTFISLVPTMLAMMTRAEGFSDGYFGDTRLIMYAGAPMNTQILHDARRVYQGDFVQSFGQTEDLPQVILSPEDHRVGFISSPQRLGSIGRPPMGVELKICGEDGRDLPPGEVGEIASRSGTAMAGYWQMPKETAQTIRDGWIFSGDLGYRDADGYVHLAGRKRHMIIRGGENVYPAEVERVLLACPGVRDAVVLGISDSVWGEIVAAVIAAEGPPPSADAVIAHCKHFLASYRCPEKVIVKDHLPYNAGGKVDRGVLRREIEEERSSI